MNDNELEACAERACDLLLLSLDEASLLEAGQRYYETAARKVRSKKLDVSSLTDADVERMRFEVACFLASLVVADSGRFLRARPFFPSLSSRMDRGAIAQFSSLLMSGLERRLAPHMQDALRSATVRGQEWRQLLREQKKADDWRAELSVRDCVSGYGSGDLDTRLDRFALRFSQAGAPRAYPWMKAAAFTLCQKMAEVSRIITEHAFKLR